jgi:hypothetical protein
VNPRWWAVLLACLVAACTSTCGGEHVAEIESRSGEVQRDEAESRQRWIDAVQGDQLTMGDGLRTGPQSVARLKLHPEGTALVEPNTIMRFLPQLPGQGRDQIVLEQGILELDSAGVELDVHTARGIARMAGGTRLRISAQGGGTRLDVIVGRVTIDDDGEQREVTAGSNLELTATAASPKITPEVSPLSTGSVAHADSEANPGGPSAPGRAELVFAAPESATIHTASPPVDVRIALTPCETGTAALEVSGPGGRKVLSPSRGAQHVLARLVAGVHRLKVRCGKQAGPERVLRVQRDPATMELPKTAPKVEVEADGRRYTVRYQNVLPAVVFVWPSAPPAARYTLTVRRKNHEQQYDLNAPRHALRTGELGEGDHEFTFRSDDGRSARGNLRIVFDNMARSAYLSSPIEGSAAAGGSVSVAGAALLRSEVSVQGTQVPLDAQGRFRTTLPSDSAKGTVSVRVSHPVTGVHYYLRRLH